MGIYRKWVTSSPTSCLVLPVSCTCCEPLLHLVGTAYRRHSKQSLPFNFPSITQAKWGKRPLSLKEGHSYHCSGNAMPAWHDHVSNRWYHNGTFTYKWAEEEREGRKMRETFTHYCVKTTTDNTYTSIPCNQLQAEFTFSYVNVLWVPRIAPCFCNTGAEGRHNKKTEWFKIVVVL